MVGVILKNIPSQVILSTIIWPLAKDGVARTNRCDTMDGVANNSFEKITLANANIAADPHLPGRSVLHGHDHLYRKLIRIA